MPRGRKPGELYIDVPSLEFKSFKETPLKADNVLRKITNLSDVDILEYTYYIIRYYDQIQDSLKYYILIPLDKKLEEKVESLKEIGYVSDGFLTIQIEPDNELIQLLERINEKMAQIYESKETYIIIVDDDIQFDSKYGHIRVVNKKLPVSHPVNRFVINNMQLARVWFEVHDFLIVSKDGKAVATRFKIVDKRINSERKRVIHISYSTGKYKNPLLAEVVEHMFKLLISDTKDFEKMIHSTTLHSLEKIVQKRIPAPYKDKTLELVKNKFDKLAPIVDYERVLSSEPFIQVDTPAGTFKTNDIVPAFVLKDIIKEYYDDTFYDILHDIKKQEKMLKSLPKEEVQKEKPSESILDKIKNIFVKEEEEPKKSEPAMPVQTDEDDDFSTAVIDAID